MSRLTDLSPERLAALLDTPLDKLNELAAKSDHLYTPRHRHKANGKIRVLHVPSHELAMVQRRLNQRLLGRLRVAKATCGFVCGRSIRDAAKPHVRRDCVVKLDIADFFPSVTEEAITEALQSRGLPNDTAPLIASLCTREGRLPQGSPTSPALSNVVFTPLDHRIAAMARAHHLRYTRYADDLTLSGPGHAPRVIPTVREIIADGGFRLRESKTRILRRGGAQRVLGITVNDGLSGSREARRRLRATLHRAEQGKAIDIEQTRGMIAHLANIQRRQARPLHEAMERLDLSKSLERRA